MKIYKFRSLGSKGDLEKVLEIINTGKFYFSKFSELNDPMEGVFTAKTTEEANRIYEGKQSYKICSFSAQKALSNPLMWGYYANGFKGVAIETDVNLETGEDKLFKVNYCDNVPDLTTTKDVEKILSVKLTPWSMEDEWRFIIQSDENKFSVGKIISLIFGDPYSSAYNKNDIYAASEKLLGYRKHSLEVISHARNSSIKIKYMDPGSLQIKNEVEI